MAQLFVVLTKTPPVDLGQKINALFPGENYPLDLGKGGEWIVNTAAGVTSKQVAEQLGLAGGAAGTTYLILSISGYHGWYAPDIWEWLKARWGQ